MVEVVENRDRNQGCADTENAAEIAQVSKACELHRLLNNQMGSLSATFQKNAEANTRAYELNQKTMDTLAEEYEAFEVTMKKVTVDHEEGDVLHAVASEAAEELDRAHKNQDRLQDELDCSCEEKGKGWCAVGK